MENNKLPGNDKLTKEFYLKFWNEVKTPPLLAIENVYLVKQLSALQKQVVIKLMGKKKTRQKVYLKLATYFLT